MAIITVLLLWAMVASVTALLEGFQWLDRKARSRRETQFIRQKLKGDYRYD